MILAPRLIVFDSGMGGLSVARAIRARIPAAQLLYVVDNGGFPYGARDDAVLTARVLAAIAAGLAHIQQCDRIVIACNTASTMVLEPLRALYRIPIVGVVPAVKWAAAVSVTRRIGVLATAATAGRPYLADLIARFAEDCRVHVHGAKRLAEYAEADFFGEAVADEAIRAEVAPMFAEAPLIDKVALGCTHYPLLLQRLLKLFPDRGFLDPSAAVADRVARVALQHRGDRWLGRVHPNSTVFTALPRRSPERLADEQLEYCGVMELGPNE